MKNIKDTFTEILFKCYTKNKAKMQNDIDSILNVKIVWKLTHMVNKASPKWYIFPP